MRMANQTTSNLVPTALYSTESFVLTRIAVILVDHWYKAYFCDYADSDLQGQELPKSTPLFNTVNINVLCSSRMMQYVFPTIVRHILTINGVMYVCIPHSPGCI